MPTPKRCLTPECNAQAVFNHKGLCSTCYVQAKRMVERNEATWEQLEHLGLVEGDKPSKFAAAFTKATTKTRSF